MVKKLLLPQEIEVFYIIPAIRRNLAIQMKIQGLKQRKIAELLHLEEAAVSQYLNNKRGNQVKFSPKVLEYIKESSTKIQDSISLLRETQRLLIAIRITGELCEIHKNLSDIPTCGPSSVNCTNVGEQNVPNTKIQN